MLINALWRWEDALYYDCGLVRTTESTAAINLVVRGRAHESVCNEDVLPHLPLDEMSHMALYGAVAQHHDRKSYLMGHTEEHGVLVKEPFLMDFTETNLRASRGTRTVGSGCRKHLQQRTRTRCHRRKRRQ